MFSILANKESKTYTIVQNLMEGQAIDQTPTKEMCTIQFQNGLVENNIWNGVRVEDVIDILIQKLEHDNQGIYKCEHNDIAISSLKGAKYAIEQRQEARKRKGILNTYEGN